MYYKIAKVASDWWIEQMKKRCSYIYPHKITGDSPNFVIKDDSFAEELSRFQSVLTNEIKHELEKYNYICLTCCRLPDRLLSDIAKKAHISTTYFPVEAEMLIEHSSIQVSLNTDHLCELPLPAEDL